MSLQVVKQNMSYKGVSRSFQTGHLEQELQMVQFSATRCSCITILWVSLVSFSTMTVFVASQVFIIVVYYVIDSVQKLLDTSLCSVHSFTQQRNEHLKVL